MVNICVANRSGSNSNIDARLGRSLMVTLRDAGIEDIAALCGGSCSCATCHVYIEPFSALPDKGTDEADMLDSLLHQKSNSRLSCQVTLVEGMPDLYVVVSPEE